MELIQTNQEIAKHVLDLKTRIVKATKGEGLYRVNWININNNTCGLRGRKNSEFMAYNEDVIFFIQVPKNAKTIY